MDAPRGKRPFYNSGLRRGLLVVLLLVDLLALLVLVLRELLALLRGDLAVGERLFLVGLDFRLALLELRGFLGRELPGLDALLDAGFLVRLALVDSGRLRRRRGRRQRRH